MLLHYWHPSLNNHALILLQMILLAHQILRTLIVILRKFAANLATQGGCMLGHITRITAISLV